MDHYLQQLYHYTKRQQKEIDLLKSSVQSLVQELQALKEKPAITVERLEYKFDQLKVETLEGTLNIGLNPADLGGIEELSVPGQINNNAVNSSSEILKEPLLRRLTKDIDQTFDTMVKDVEEQAGYEIDKSYYELMKQDIQRQLPARVDFYLQQFRSQNTKEISEEELQEQIHKAIVNDVQRGIHTFITQLPKNVRTNQSENGKDDNK
ncbi:spore germination protein GerPC [Bacillus niameyensis]|uniref:spore germination protein GerPC n=1 Tax=Bacillus niameyensis TaxID=1522308 RepID=UPI00078164F2|nr:spore germination protein GerPC [Bacillus niameyensis]